MNKQFIHIFKHNFRVICNIKREWQPIIHNASWNYFPSTVIFRIPVQGLPTISQKVKTTEYVITGRFSEQAKETAAAKMRRVILNAAINS